MCANQLITSNIPHIALSLSLLVRNPHEILIFLNNNNNNDNIEMHLRTQSSVKHGCIRVILRSIYIYKHIPPQCLDTHTLLHSPPPTTCISREQTNKQTCKMSSNKTLTLLLALVAVVLCLGAVQVSEAKYYYGGYHGLGGYSHYWYPHSYKYYNYYPHYGSYHSRYYSSHQYPNYYKGYYKHWY